MHRREIETAWFIEKPRLGALGQPTVDVAGDGVIQVKSTCLFESVKMQIVKDDRCTSNLVSIEMTFPRYPLQRFKALIHGVFPTVSPLSRMGTTCLGGHDDKHGLWS